MVAWSKVASPAFAALSPCRISLTCFIYELLAQIRPSFLLDPQGSFLNGHLSSDQNPIVHPATAPSNRNMDRQDDYTLLRSAEGIPGFSSVDGNYESKRSAQASKAGGARMEAQRAMTWRQPWHGLRQPTR